MVLLHTIDQAMKVNADIYQGNFMNYETTFCISLALAALGAVVVLTLWQREVYHE